MHNDDSVTLSRKEINFLMQKFEAKTADEAVERFIEFLVGTGQDPMELKRHLARLMARENN